MDILTLLSYFNTVGSKEGWTPKAFVSSRSNRNKDAIQRPEDFMDDEDLAEAAESRQLETAQSFATIGRVGDSQGDAFFGLFMTEEDTMGVKIAQKMGWRRDQGVGRRIRRLARLDEGNTSTKEADSAHMFAPKDARTMPVAREDVNRKGLGYQSEARLGTVKEKEDDEPPSLALPFLEGSKTRTTKKSASKKSSFGVGVLNDTGSDDEDPYELGPKITFNRTLGKDKKVKKPSKFAKPGASERHVFVPKKASKAMAAVPRLSYDGKLPLTGFVLAVKSVDLTTKRRFHPPKIPSGWTSAKAASFTSSARDYQSTADAAKASTLDAKARASLLGETPLPGRSVFDFISKEGRDRIAALTGKTDLPQGLGQMAPEGQQSTGKAQVKDLWTFVPTLDKGVAAAALAKGATGWMPYSEDPKKRARYVGFLELRAGLKSDLPERTNSMSVSDWAKELGEFAHAAQVFKPTSGIMASRFTSSTSSSQAGSGDGAAGESLLRKPIAKPEDPAEQAAKLGMYGPMTRSSFPFYPSRLLCKRFNVKPPPDMPHSSEFEAGGYNPGKTEEAVSRSAMDKMMNEVLTRGAPALQRPAWMNAVPQEPASVGSPAAPEASIGHAHVDVEDNEALAQERVSEDVFKAIFGDDDDDDE